MTALRAHVLGLAQAEAARTIAGDAGARRARAAGDRGARRVAGQEAAPRAADGAAHDDTDDGVSLVVAVQRLFALEVAAAAPVEADAVLGRARRGKRSRQEGGRSLSDGTLIIGTRGSALARWQAGGVDRLLRAAHPTLEVRQKIIVTAAIARSRDRRSC